MLEHELEKTIKRLRTISAGAEGLLRALYDSPATSWLL